MDKQAKEHIVYGIAILLGVITIIATISFIRHIRNYDDMPDDILENFGVLGEEWHYGVPHGIGNPKEDASGCPCVTIASGYSSYCNFTNAIAHGKGSVYDELRKSELSNTNRFCRLTDVIEVENRIMKEIQEESK